MFYRSLIFILLLLFPTHAFASNAGGGVIPGISLGTSASATNPQRSGQAGTGLYSVTTGHVTIAGLSQPIADFVGVASAVDFFTITNSATANPANLTIAASGTDTNENIVLMPKGNGGIAIGTTTTAANTVSFYGSTNANFVSMSVQNSVSGNTGAAFVLVNDIGVTGALQLLSSTFGGGQANNMVFAGQKALQFLSDNTVAFGSDPIDFRAGGFSAAIAMRIQAGATVSIGTTAIASGSELTVQGQLDVNNTSGDAFRVVNTASQVDYIQIAGGIAGSPGTATMTATGTDTNINLNCISKGSGQCQSNGSTILTGAGTGISTSGATVNSNAVWQANFQPGLLTSVTNTIGVFGKVSKVSTVDNMVASTLLLSCITNPTVSFYECGTSTTCATPTTIASVQVTATGTATPATISSSVIAAGDYIGWAISAGTCTSLDISATAQIHSN